MSFSLKQLYRKPLSEDHKMNHILMGEGNIGALSILTQVFMNMPECVAMLEALDDMNIRGEQLYCAYKDYALNDSERLVDGIKNRSGRLVDVVNEKSGSLWAAVLSGASTISRPTLRKPTEQDYQSEYYNVVVNEIAKFYIYEEMEGSNPTLYGTMITETQAKDLFGDKHYYYPLKVEHIQSGIIVTPRVISKKAGPHAEV